VRAARTWAWRATDCAPYARPRGASMQVSTALSLFVMLILENHESGDVGYFWV
jgi:hypothetical protein